MRTKHFTHLVIVLVLLAGFPRAALAQDRESGNADSPDVAIVQLVDGGVPQSAPDGQITYALFGQNLVSETEPNNTTAQANILGSDTVALGNIFPNADEDYYSFSASTGDRVYTALMTSRSSNGSTDSQLYLYDTDGVTLLEFDEDDGSLGGLSSSMSGVFLPNTGTYYLRVKHSSATSQLRPYHLHLRVQSGSPTAEVEPNDVTPQALPASGWIAGSTSATTDLDLYSINLNAGDTVFISLDMDPERDTVEWNGQVGLGAFNGFYLVVNDSGAATPDSEAFFMTVKDAGSYTVFVGVPGGGTTFGSYHLSVSVHPALAQNCSTYFASDVPVTIPDGPGMVFSTLSVPDSMRIGDVNLNLGITHANMLDLDVVLTSPAGNTVGLFTDVGSNTQPAMNLGLDDEAGIPVGIYTVVSGMVNSTELAFSLDWFDGEEALGNWELDIYDDTALNGGTLDNWSITICEPLPQPTCPVGTVETVIYSSDFEADDGGFTHSGTVDEWARGLPSFAPITTCNSGTNCWKTDLAGSYNASSSQDLLSPNINLAGYTGSAWVTWAQKTQIESASFDHATVTVQQAGGGSPRTLWQWLGATQTVTVGDPAVTIQESSGWGVFTQDISDYLGQNIELNFHLDSDTSVQLAGYAVDDVYVHTCAPLEITLDKTVGTNPSTCATSDEVTAAPGSEVTYCYKVTNTGQVTLSTHTLVDSELGVILNEFPYSLSPGASAFLTQTATIYTTTVNTATWTAFNPGPTDVISATDTALVTIVLEPVIAVMPAALSSTQYPDEVIVEQLTIDNIGDAALNWWIEEYPDESVRAVPASTNQLPPARMPAASHALPIPESGTLPAPNSPLAVLYDQTDNAGTNGFPSQNFEAINNAYDNAGADDFTVPITDGVWSIEAVDILGSYSGLGPLASVDVVFYADDAGLPGTAVYTATNIIPLSDVGGDISVALPSPAVLSAGNYWISVVGNMDFSPSGQWFWSTRSTQSGNAYAWQNPLNGFGTGCTIWNYGASGCGVGGGIEPDALFRLSGFVGEPVCYTPGNIPWLSSFPTAGTVSPDSQDLVGVSFDSAGLTPGEYTANICVNSNDPATPLVVVPVTLTVVVNPGADLSLLKSAQPVATVGEPITYTLAIANAGPGTATSVVLTDTLPAGVTFISASAGCSEAGGVVTCNLGNIASGDNTTVVIVIITNTPGTLENSAEVSSTVPDSNAVNNTDTATTVVALPIYQLYLPLVLR